MSVFSGIALFVLGIMFGSMLSYSVGWSRGAEFYRQAIHDDFRKLKQFCSGWNEIARDAIFPVGKVNRKGEMVLWVDQMTDMSIFECKEFGRQQATEYLEALGHHVQNGGVDESF